MTIVVINRMAGQQMPHAVLKKDTRTAHAFCKYPIRVPGHSQQLKQRWTVLAPDPLHR